MSSWLAPDYAASAMTRGARLFGEEAWSRFWSYVDARGVDECWEWRGPRNRAGYGSMGVNGSRQYAHRMIAAALLGRPLSSWPEECACHHCDNPPCVNPRHIFVGSPLDNARDMLRKGRNPFGAKTRIDRIRVTAERQRARADKAAEWVISLCGREPDTTIEDVDVACDVELVGAEPEPRPSFLDEALDIARWNRALDEAVADLKPMWRSVITLRREGHTLHECGIALDLTRERVRQIEEKAIARLRRHPRVVAIVRGRPAPGRTEILGHFAAPEPTP